MNNSLPTAPRKIVFFILLLLAPLVTSLIMGIEEVSLGEIIMSYSASPPTSCTVLVGEIQSSLSDEDLALLLATPLHRKSFYHGSSKESITYSLFLSDGTCCGIVRTNGRGLSYKGSNYVIAEDISENNLIGKYFAKE